MKIEFLAGGFTSKVAENEAWKKKLAQKVHGRREQTHEESKMVRFMEHLERKRQR